jgi:hypothetical protein
MNLAVSVVIAAFVIAIAIVVIFVARQRSARLQRRFGPEYERAVQESGSKYRAEARLGKLEKRVKKFDIRPLSSEERLRYREQWRAIQARFVDDPDMALRQADEIVNEVMSACGYPLTDFEDQAAQLSVDHPLIVEHYRDAHATAVRRAHGEGSTEDVRRALIHYRTLFEELVAEPIAVGGNRF